MASPFSIYVSPSGVKIDQLDVVLQGANNNTSATAKKYRISNSDDFSSMFTDPDGVDNVLEGYTSPTYSVTMPDAAKNKAGIPTEAMYYAYMYPPPGMAPKINWKRYNQQQSLDNPFTSLIHMERSTRSVLSIDSEMNTPVKNIVEDDEDLFERNPPTTSEIDIANISILGGFVYFDKDHNVILVNSFTLKETVFKLKMAGPFEGLEGASSAMFKLNRVHPIMSSTFHESGYIGLAWVRPEELFGLFPATKKHAYHHGGFAFFREDGTYIFYALETREYLDPLGDVDIIADCFQTAQETLLSKNFSISDDDFSINTARFKAFCLNEVKKLKDENRTIRGGEITTYTAFSRGHTYFQNFLQNEKHACRKDEKTWNPLHYVCKYRPDDVDLVRMIMKLSPESVFEADHYGRLPLHIACDSGASDSVIIELLKYDESGSEKTATKATNRLKLLPLHIACEESASRTVVKALLQGNERTILERTGVGRLPLHVAITHRASSDVIELLLDTYEDVQDLEPQLHHPDDINVPFRGLLPLHIACWNNCPSTTISLLLDKDVDSETIDEEINLALGKSTKYLHASTGTNNHQDLYTSHMFNQMTPLHLALRHGSTETIHLLLQKEQQKRREPGEMTTVDRVDSKGRFPLHIACKKSKDPSIIKDILDLDAYNNTTQMKDYKESMPLHYACNGENANPIIANNLIHAERMLVDYDNKVAAGDRSVYCFDKFNRTPFIIAVKTGAPQEVIRILLDPQNFTLRGFDRATISTLSERVCKDRTSQALVIEQFTKRRFFSLFFIEFVVNIVGLITFIVASINVTRGEETIGFTETFILWICIGFLAFREFAQMYTAKGTYLFDTWSWFQWAGIVTTTMSLIDMIDIANVFMLEPYERKTVYMITGSLLVLNLIFFLRAAFLSFARFVGGLILIFRVLIPFFLVSGLLLLLFAYNYYMFPTAIPEQPKCDGNQNLWSCYLHVARSFLALEEARGWLDIIFGLVVVVVLLNVVIAIVCEAWDSANTERFYWNYRIQWLADARFLVRREFQEDDPISKYIDRMSFIPLMSPNKSPWEDCATTEHYEHPHFFFEKPIADRITSSRSLSSNMYWYTHDIKDGNKFALEMMRLKVVLSWSLSNLRYIFFIGAGFFTAGMLWPVNFRRSVLMTGNRSRSDEGSDADKINSIISLIENESVKAELRAVAKHAEEQE